MAPGKLFIWLLFAIFGIAVAAMTAPYVFAWVILFYGWMFR